ncbi:MULTISPECIES: HTTM domain-containing protein [unclassified Streptomyces]|uniref:HTTM domain-containing protein n=1 Tax=unclassified Streptomyces TaxID=2593676 RepID=UPI00225BB422|nr:MULTISPECIES: HTTM domain-containing protein [unclassified Streptomyces]MCX4989596.1 HTTM domain-containing protein [Streptomyces sp. NBC_00568]MCX5005164.1 HTTM domain-containing protein [Streptomyces sp. NBC_00638]
MQSETRKAAAFGAERWLADRISTAWHLLTGRPVSLYAASVLRIGYGLLYLIFLLREFPHRAEIWGPDSPWTPALAQQLFEQTGWMSILTLSDSRAYFELCYVFALVTSALFLLGWRTRVMSVLFAVVVCSFHARAIFMTDGGDNLVLLMAIYLVLTACGRRWSLDARRARLKAPRTDNVPEPAGSLLARQLHESRTTLITVVHNCGMFVIAAQVCFLYGSAGLYKVQGASWGGGTALHYVLNLELFRPWPALSHVVDEYTLLVAIAGYLTVLLQVAFPFVLFGRLKYPVLVMLLGMHIGIAVLMGLPLFSGAMIVADAAFLPDRFYTFLPRLCRRAAQGRNSRRSALGRAAGSGTVPPQAGPGTLGALGSKRGAVRPTPYRCSEHPVIEPVASARATQPCPSAGDGRDHARPPTVPADSARGAAGNPYSGDDGGAGEHG